MLFRCEDGEDGGYDARAGGELVLTCLIEAEGTESVDNGLEDLRKWVRIGVCEKWRYVPRWKVRYDPQ